jgi:hypothetical protein
MLAGLFLNLLFLPLVQLGAALVAALILIASARPDKAAQLRQLGKIVVGTVVGTLLGGLALAIGFFVVCSR